MVSKELSDSVDSPSGPTGYTIMWNKNGLEIRPFVKGLWAKWFKLDIFMVRWLRPVPKRPPSGKTIRVTRIGYFKKKVRNAIMLKRQGHDACYDDKYDRDNPWKGQFWFVLDTRCRFPSVFLSLFGRFYIGIKTYSAEAELPEPYDHRANSGGDITWMPDDAPTGRYGCPSITIRSEYEESNYE